MNLEQLVYISTATAPNGPITDISDIVREAKRHNPANNVTGALAFTESRFVQILEGSHGSLDVLILKLMIDPRHRDLIFIDRAKIRTRSFGAWSMASPALTSSGELRLARFLANEDRPMNDFRQLLLDMVAEQPVRPPTA
jgi:hypothetical protein